MTSHIQTSMHDANNTMSGSECMIKAVNLCKYYGGFAAVEDINFEIPRRQVCALLGPNGAGKSTTMKLLTGFLAPTSGSISIAGHDVQTDRIRASEHIGYLPENGPLYEEMTPSSSLKYHGKVRGLNSTLLRDRIDFVVEKCDLADVWNKTISKLSRGYRQRVGMAQALLHDPDILILDEPTSGLDPNQLVGVRQLIRDLGSSKSVLLSTHILQEVEVVCSRVLLINQGHLVFDGSLEEMTKQNSMENQFHQLTGFSA
ncbi:MAG TPA: ATP-binding cassette domain-containing protein [Pirellulaceae bacterium]|nr:ATP-binding cassette domain-containing protein [Pirellulaceae bacterium]HMO91754.1 ATP-binding cassette domain-containing protein [Pirellulaceae bacterium]HMP69553.1 ATP-binding cassette domain-containing protein [Pirellulaceae bacterium]